MEACKQPSLQAGKPTRQLHVDKPQANRPGLTWLWVTRSARQQHPRYQAGRLLECLFSKQQVEERTKRNLCLKMKYVVCNLVI